MAFEISDGSGTPHATDYSDLLAKLATFLLAQPSYSAHVNDGTELIVETTGLSGTESILFGIRKYANVGAGSFGWFLNGYTGFDSGLQFHTQPGAIDPTLLPGLPLWNNPIPYWFFANAQRVIVVAKASGRYVAAYLGKFFPWGSPLAYPYPLWISGTAKANYVGGFLPVTIDNNGNGNTVGWMPFNNNDGGLPAVRLADGTWYRLNNPTGGGWSGAADGVWPWVEIFGFSTGGFFNQRPGVGTGGTDKYTVWQTMIVRASSSPGNIAHGDILGTLDGVGFVAGFGNGAENVADDGVDDWIVFNNVFRVDGNNFFAIKKV